MLKRKAKCVDLPAAICNALKTLKDPTTKDKKREQAQEDVEKSMALLREGLYGLSGTELVEAADVAEELVSVDFIAQVLANLEAFPFDTRKHFKDIFTFFCKAEPTLLVKHLESKPALLATMVQGLKVDHQTALICCEMLKGAAKHPQLCAMLMRDSKSLALLFEAISNEDFALSSSAYNTLKDVLCESPATFCSIIASSPERSAALLERMHALIAQGSIMHRRKTIHLLETLLTFPKANDMCERYVSDAANVERLVDAVKAHPELSVRMVKLFKLFAQSGPDPVKLVLGSNRALLVETLMTAKVDAKQKADVDEAVALLSAL